MLGRNGITCTTCMNVRDVVTAIRQSDYDMILTDVQMPDIDGLQAFDLIRHGSPTIPVVLSSGYSIDYGVLMLGVLICSLPTGILFLVLQKSFANGIVGAVKG